MIAQLHHKKHISEANITITGSKSESNRLLILKAFYNNLNIKNLSNSDDTIVLEKALNSPSNVIDVHHAGTAMRFLTAYLAVTTKKQVTLTGSARMQERPISILVNALNALGAKITYKNKEGYPPIIIKPPGVLKNSVTLNAGVSSQYISALMLVAPLLKEGLSIFLAGEITSRPYIEMTLKLLTQMGIPASFINEQITISATKSIEDKTVIVESDWSSASYFYSIVALAPSQIIKLSSYKQDSLQGDAALAKIYTALGVSTRYNNDDSITLTKNIEKVIPHIELDLTKTPDIAQTIAVTCYALGVSCHLTGLHTLKIKETDRLEALKNELGKLGARVSVTNNTCTIKKRIHNLKLLNPVVIKTYQDHRMAMAFAPLALVSNIAIEDPWVVTKSYPDFYSDLEKVGIFIER